MKQKYFLKTLFWGLLLINFIPVNAESELSNKKNILPDSEIKKLEDFAYYKFPIDRKLVSSRNALFSKNYKDALFYLEQFISNNKRGSRNYTLAVRVKLHILAKYGDNIKNHYPLESERAKRFEARVVLNRLLRENAESESALKFENRVKTIRDRKADYKTLIPEMVKIPSGRFKVNCHRLETCVSVNVPSFRISKYEVTQEQWSFIMDDESLLADTTSKYPAVVSKNDAKEFISRLNNITKKNYRLPTSLEWEYMARPNKDDPEYWGNIQRQNEVNERKPVQVGQYKPNKYGLYDLYGNVSEWIQDCYKPGNRGAIDIEIENEAQRCRPRYQMLRGGYFNESYYSVTRQGRSPTAGFRIAR